MPALKQKRKLVEPSIRFARYDFRHGLYGIFGTVHPTPIYEFIHMTMLRDLTYLVDFEVGRSFCAPQRMPES